MIHFYDDQKWSEPACSSNDQTTINPSWCVGMAYVPMQNWSRPLPIEEGFRKGTVFQDLDKPFLGR